MVLSGDKRAFVVPADKKADCRSCCSRCVASIALKSFLNCRMVNDPAMMTSTISKCARLLPRTSTDICES